MCIRDSRGGTLLASSVGNENCWDDFQNPDGSPKENGAFTLTLQDAPFTALLPFQNHLMLFREGDFFELYGTRPSNFALTQVAGLGVKEPRHLTAFDDRLYFFSQNRVWLYQGGGVSDLLGHLGWRFEDCALQAFGGGLLIAAGESVYLWQDGCLLELEEGLHCDRLSCEGGQVYGLDWGEGVCWQFLAGPRPVSYTHLDVYKRQPWERPCGRTAAPPKGGSFRRRWSRPPAAGWRKSAR